MDKQQQVTQVAQDLLKQNPAPSWGVFFREILGKDGIVRKMYPDQASFAEFEKSEAHAEIQRALAKLRETTNRKVSTIEPTRVITVRLPESLHAALKLEAHNHQTSMNQLCISKLLQMVDENQAPTSEHHGNEGEEQSQEEEAIGSTSS